MGTAWKLKLLLMLCMLCLLGLHVLLRRRLKITRLVQLDRLTILAVLGRILHRSKRWSGKTRLGMYLQLWGVRKPRLLHVWLVCFRLAVRILLWQVLKLCCQNGVSGIFSDGR